MSLAVTLEAVVTADGLVVPPEELDKFGAHPGDRVVVNLQQRKPPRPMMGFARSSSGAAFSTEDLRELRVEMGAGIGEDLVGG